MAITFAIGANCLGQSNEWRFYGEDPFRKPVALTDPMIRSLDRSVDFRECYLPNKSRTETTKIDLNADGRYEILVKSGCGNSAASYSFWVIKEIKRGVYQPIFRTATMGIYVQRKRHRGFRDILAKGCTANTCFYQYFVFTGTAYRRTGSWERPNY